MISQKTKFAPFGFIFLALGLAVLAPGWLGSAGQDPNKPPYDPALEKLDEGLKAFEERVGETRKKIRELRDIPAEEKSDEKKAAPEAEAEKADAATSAPVKEPPVVVPAKVVVPEYSGQAKVLYVVLDSDVGPHMQFVVHRAMETAEKEGADLFLIELDTPGGRVDSAGHIRNELLEAEMTTAITIKRATSAGALIALACDNIFMTPGSHIGYATPMMLIPGAAPTTGEDLDIKEKMLRYVVKEFEATAEAKGHRKDLARAFVDRQEEIPGLIEQGKLLGLTAEQAVEQGLAISVVASRQQLFEKLKVDSPQIVEFNITSAEKFALTVSIWGAPLCLIFGLLGLFFEIKSPGFGVPGTMGLFFLGMFFWANFVVMNADWFEIALFVLGFGLLIAEVAFIPGFGVAGISGIACIALSVFLSMFQLPAEGFAMSWEIFRWPLQSLLLVSIVTIVLLAFGAKYFHQTTLWKRVELSNTLASADGFVSAPNQDALIGGIGRTASVLRPVGVVTIDGQRKDAITQGDFIEKGATVRVIGVDGAQLIVEEA